MQTPPRIVFEGVEPTDAVRAQVLDELDKLEQVFDRLTDARVVVELPHQRHQTGNRYNVKIFAAIPRHGDVVVDRDQSADPAHEDVAVAIRDAFRAARRQLKGKKQILRGRVKSHEGPPEGRVVALFPDFGFIEAPDGHRVYFHANSVVDGGFDALEEGAQVRFAEEQGHDGPQASTVHVIG